MTRGSKRAVSAVLLDPGRSAPTARLGVRASRAATSRCDAGAAVGGVPRRRCRRLQLFLVLRSLPGLGRAVEADDAADPPRRRQAVRRFSRARRRGDRCRPGADFCRRASWAAGDLACTGRNPPMRRSCAMPRASLRSVLITIAESAAFTCRVSSTTTSNPAATKPAYNHCDRGHASSPIRGTPVSSQRKNLTRPPARSPPSPRARSCRRHPPRTRCSVPMTHQSRQILHDCPPMMLGADQFGPRFTPSLWRTAAPPGILAEAHYGI
jgi:hypothetical protein